MKLYGILRAILGPVLVLAACGDQPPISTEEHTAADRTDSAGIEIVRNTAGDHNLEWTFAEVFSAGGGGDDGLEFYRLSADADRNGNVYVLDRGNHRVVVFGPNGDPIRTLGREGGGPGELGIPVGLAVTEDGRVSVYDIRKHGLVNFAPDGSVQPEQRVDLPYTGGRIERSGHLLGLTVSGPGADEGREVERVLEVTDAGPKELVRLERAGPVPTTFPSCGITMQDMPPFFQPTLRWALRDTMVFAVTSADYVVDLVSRDGRVASYRRNVGPQEATLEMATAEVGEDMRFGNRVCKAWDIAEQVGYATAIPVITDLRPTSDGTLWVKRHSAPDQPSLIDIFDESGEYLGTLPPGSPFPAAFLPDGRIVAAETDELGVERVVVYRVTKTQP